MARCVRIKLRVPRGRRVGVLCPRAPTARTQFVAPPKRARIIALKAYDGHRQRVLLTGGNSPVLWQKRRVCQRHSTISGRSMACAGAWPSRHPGCRCGGCARSDSRRGRVLSFGGSSGRHDRYPTCAFSRMICGRMLASTARNARCRLRGSRATRDAAIRFICLRWVGGRRLKRMASLHREVGRRQHAWAKRSRRRARRHWRAHAMVFDMTARTSRMHLRRHGLLWSRSAGHPRLGDRLGSSTVEGGVPGEFANGLVTLASPGAA